MRAGIAMILAAVATGCAQAPVAPPGATFNASLPDAFAGAWRSTTPTLEFVQLSVASLSSEQGALGARLTLSGVAWEGSGRIDGDSLVAPMAVVGATSASGTFVARARDAHTLIVRFRSAAAAPLDMTFARQD